GDRARYQAVCRVVWQEKGVSELTRCLGQRHEFGAISVVVRLSGTAVGQLTATLASRRDSRRS
ncbi:MAG: hypothetical protein ACYDB3_02935, partial [Acidimicrobiales bacterium]